MATTSYRICTDRHYTACTYRLIELREDIDAMTKEIDRTGEATPGL